MSGRNRNIFRDYGIAVIAAVAIALLIRFFVIEAYRIPTPAMRPTLEPGDTIFVTKRPLVFDGSVSRGDVLVFESPQDPGREYIKRVIGIAGDVVALRKGHVTLNGKLIEGKATRGGNAPCGKESLPGPLPTFEYEVCWEQPFPEDFGPEKIPEGSIFILGDLRSQSPSDTKKRRSWGIIPLSAVKGKARWIWLSVAPDSTRSSILSFPQIRFDRMFRRIE